jgi:hypothetical protein
MSNTYKIVKDIDTGKYFDGSDFQAPKESALHFPPHITEMYFKYSYEHVDVVVEDTDRVMHWETDHCPL